MNPDEFFQAGKVVKVSGSNGELILVFDTDQLNALKKMESVFILLQGNLVPFFIEHFSPKGHNQALVKFMDYNEQEEVLQLVGAPLFLPHSVKPGKKRRNTHDLNLEGYSVHDKNHGAIGIVVNVLELPMQEIMEVDHMGKMIMIPFVEEFVIEIDTKKKLILVETPEGLVELYQK